MDIEVVTNMADFASLREEWNALLSRSATRHIFLTHEWQYTWWKHFGTGDENLLILLVRAGGNLVGIAPLRRDRLTIKGLPVFRTISFLLGYEADYRDFLLHNEARWEVLEQILTYCASEIDAWHLIVLAGVHGGSATNYLLPMVCSRRDLHLRSAAGAICPYIPLQGQEADTWAQYERRSTIKEYQRKRRKMAREYRTGTAFYRGESSIGAMSDFFHLHHRGWSERGGSEALSSQSIERFHVDLAKSFAPTGQLFLAMLNINDTPIAARYCYTCGSAGFGYLSGYDPDYHKLSPGAVLTLEVIDHLRTEGYEEMDLTRGDEAYKLNFTKIARTSMWHVIAKSPFILKMVGVLEALGR